ncbi:MAG: sulfite exporter TauE/SafE family protein [Candidatus Latescibacterota bacterium]
MDLQSLVLLFVFSFFVGSVVGGTGIGGVLLVPYLVFILRMDAATAIASTMFALIFSGLAATFAYARMGSVKWPMVWAICGAAAPAAFLGSLAVWIVPGEILLGGIAILTIFSGYRTLRPPKKARIDNEDIKARALILVGGISGYISALVGAGGAVVLIPLMFAMGAPALLAIGLSQAIQFVIALTSTIGHLSVGKVDFVIGGVIATALVLGILIGTRIAHTLPLDILRKTVAWVLTLVGLSIAFQLVRNTIAI